MTMFTTDLKYVPWWWEAAPRPVLPPPVLPAEADVAVVGAGYTGLSAALTLARAGRSVVVFEAGDPGQGASSRNGGMIGSGHHLTHASLSAKYGEDAAGAILKEGLAALEYTVNLIDSEKIDCQFKRVGRFRAACRPRDYEAVAREVETLRRTIGLEAHVVGRADQHLEVASDFYHGGAVYPRHGGLHPALFHQGLLDRAADAGALVAGRTPAERLRRTKHGFEVSSPAGTLRVRDVIVATNGYTGKLTPGLRRRLMPLSSYIIATEELGEARVRSLFPSGKMIVETRSLHGYYRPSPDGRRILFGGRAALHAIDPKVAGKRLRRYLIQLFPDLRDVRISHAWTGHIAFTRMDMPHVGVRNGIHYAMGYCGSGVAMAPYLGYRAAHKVLGTREGRTAFDDVPFPAWPLHWGEPWFLPAVDIYYRWRMQLFG